MASHLRVPVQELKRRITFTEFLEWLEFLRWEQTRVTKQDWYLAQIAAEVRRSLVKEPKKVKVADHFIRFEEQMPTEKGMTSKQIWTSVLGVNVNKN